MDTYLSKFFHRGIRRHFGEAMSEFKDAATVAKEALGRIDSFWRNQNDCRACKEFEVSEWTRVLEAYAEQVIRDRIGSPEEARLAAEKCESDIHENGVYPSPDTGFLFGVSWLRARLLAQGKETEGWR